MSSEKVKKVNYGESALSGEARRFGKFLREYAKLRGWKQREVARLTGFNTARVNHYFEGRRLPERPILEKILRDIGAKPEDWDAGVIADPPADYRVPDARERRIMADLDELLKSGDDEILDHLKRQVSMLVDLHKRRKQQP